MSKPDLLPMSAVIDSSLFPALILNWFDQHGRKNLPWQENKTPYRVWISEIMLQQTQVATVIPYFLRFMQRFPQLSALADAHEDEVMHLWAGLGYYSRARNLHRAAKIIMEKFAGTFPSTLADLQTLPGIGQSTAGAILAIAFNQQATILDGNVKRVLARFHGIGDPINEKTTENKLWEYAINYTPQNRVADYTQAMMDLGATLCMRAKPECAICPLKIYCEAYRLGVANELPRKKMTRELPVRAATFLIIKNGDEVLLYKRPTKGIWGGLWSLPELPDKADSDVIRDHCRAQWNMTPAHEKAFPAFRHTFSHYHLDIFPILITLEHRGKIVEDALQIWYNPRKPTLIGLPKPVQTLLRELT